MIPVIDKPRLPIIPYGPGTSYATVNDLPDWVADAKMSILDMATGTVSSCYWVFHNEGVDCVNCGRPSFLGSMQNGINEFTIDFTAKLSGSGFRSYISVGADTSTSTQQQINIANSIV